MIKRFINLIVANAILFFAISADAQFGFGKPKSGLQPMRSAVDLIKKQAPLRVNQALLAKISPGDVRVIISLGKQRAYLTVGKQGHTADSGNMHIVEKDDSQYSSLDVDFVDSSGRIVRAGVSMHIDA